MTNRTQLRQAAEASLVKGEELAAMSVAEFSQNAELRLAFPSAANPKAVLELLDEIERLKKDAAWMPTDTAPKHKEVLVWRDDSGPFFAQLTTPDAIVPDDVIHEFPDDFEAWFSPIYGWQEGTEKPTLWRLIPVPEEQKW